MKPLIESLSNPTRALQWTIFHVLLGAILTFFPGLFSVYFAIILLYNSKKVFEQAIKGNIDEMILLLSYLFSFEIMSRITKSNPIPPTEYTKYFMIAVCVFIISTGKRKANSLGLLLLLLVIPSLFIDKSGERESFDIINNMFGPLALSLGVAVFGSKTPSIHLIDKSLRLIFLPLICSLVSMFISTPDFDQIQFSYSNTIKTTGGVASNQASTMLGLGMFISYYSIHTGLKFSGKRLLDIGFMILFAIQGLLTFSRGGMIVGAIAIVLTVLLTQQTTLEIVNAKRFVYSKKRSKPIFFILISAISLFVSFNYIETISSGKLSARYSGETAGTIGGNVEKDLNKITTGRSNIIIDDMKVWSEYPFLGCGAGASHHMRNLMTGNGIVPHSDISKQLAECGMLGLFYYIIIFYLGWTSWQAKKRMHSGDVLFILYVIGLLTSFHAATRTFVTPFLIAYSSMSLNALSIGKSRI